MRQSLQAVLAATLAVGFWPVHAHAQDKHVTVINNCTAIDKPGAYQVGKVIQASDKDLILVPPSPVVACIAITVDFVTLDLGGNTIIGPGTSSAVAVTAGIGAVARRNVTIHSGMITNFAVGVEMQDDPSGVVASAGYTVHNINASGNGIGIEIGGSGHRIIGNIADANAIGFNIGCPSVILGNMATGNTAGDLRTFGGICTRAHNNPFIGDQP